MLLVVAYDVADDRRRVKLHKLLLSYGVPVQESVFECDVTERQKRAIQRRVERLVRPSADRVRYYSLCVECARRREEMDGSPVVQSSATYVV